MHVLLKDSDEVQKGREGMVLLGERKKERDGEGEREIGTGRERDRERQRRSSLLGVNSIPFPNPFTCLTWGWSLDVSGSLFPHQ